MILYQSPRVARSLPSPVNSTCLAPVTKDHTLKEVPFLTHDTCRLLETGFFADAEIRLGKRVWKLHLNIICVRSKYFKATFTGPFNVRNDALPTRYTTLSLTRQQESTTRSVKLDEDTWTKEQINALLAFIYTSSECLSSYHFGSVRMTKVLTRREFHSCQHLQDSQRRWGPTLPCHDEAVACR